MQLPFEFPDWMPWWLQLIIVVAAILTGLVFLLMPFSVFGLKTRLDIIESRLDEIQSDLRALALRAAEPVAYEPPATLRTAEPPPPPVPAARESVRPTLRAAARVGEAARERAEPRLRKPSF